MKNILHLLMLVTCLVSCSTNHKKQENPVDTNIIVNVSDTVNTPVKSTKVIKYFFSVIVITRPVMRGLTDSGYSFDLQSFPKVSPIIVTERWNEYTEQTALESFENSIKPDLDAHDEGFQAGANFHPPEKANEKTQIMTKKVYVFGSYEEANKAREKIIDYPEKYDPNL